MADNKALFGDDDNSDDMEEEIDASEAVNDKKEVEVVNEKDTPASDGPKDVATTSGEDLKKKSKPDNKALFGDDDDTSSDDDDDESNVKMVEKKVDSTKDNEPKASTKVKAEDDDDDSDEMFVRKDSSPPPKNKVTSNTGLSDDDSDDDAGSDDAEFDDAGAKIVGLNSTTLAGAKAIETALAIRKANMAANYPDGDDDSVIIMNKNNMSRDDDGDEPAKPIVKMDRPMTVQEIKTRPDPSRHELFITKLPNILGIQTECFDPDTYSAKAEEEEFGQSAFNLMRWRYKRDSGGEVLRDKSTGELLRESNARLVEWEDGSYTLHVGTESFQIDLINSSDPKSGFAGINGYFYLSQTATYGKDPNRKVDPADVDNEEKKEEEAAGTVLECMGAFTSRLAVRPSSLQSEAHKSLTVGIRQKTIKKARITEIVTQEDPEKIKQERIKVKQDLDRAESRKRGASNRNSYGDGDGGGARRRPRMSRDYLEDDDDGNYDTTNIRAMKKRTMRSNDDFIDDEIDDMDGYRRFDDDEEIGGDDDDEEDDTFHRVRPGRGNKAKQQQLQQERKKVLKDDDDDDDEDDYGFGGGGKKSSGTRPKKVVDDDDDDDDEDVVINVNRTKKRAHQSVFDDDDDDNSD